MPRVIVPSLRYKASPDGYVPAADVSPARAFGEIVYLITPGNHYVTQIAIDDAVSKLEDLREDDIILLTGDMVFCSIAIGEMAMRFGKIRLLRWDGKDGCYSLEEWDWPMPDDDEDQHQESLENVR